MPHDAAPAYYVTSLDRIGLAVLAGGGCVGLFAVLALLAAGGSSPFGLVVAGAVVTIVAMLGIVTAAGPVWVLLHRRSRRGPGVAATTAGLLALILFTLAQMSGAGGGGYRLASALGTSLLVALFAAAVGVAMQRVAYRRLL